MNFWVAASVGSSVSLGFFAWLVLVTKVRALKWALLHNYPTRDFVTLFKLSRGPLVSLGKKDDTRGGDDGGPATGRSGT